MTEAVNTCGAGKGKISGNVLFALVFAAFTVLRCVLSVFPKIETTCWDEPVNLELAQNIWLRGSLTVYGRPAGFFGILYPVVLAPFYAVEDPAARMTAISLFNAVLVSSAMIPAWLLCRTILKRERERLAAVLMFALVPDLWLAATCMSECLYIPMAMWGFWLFYRAFEKGIPNGQMSAGLGLWVCLMCMSGTGGTAMAGSAVALYLCASGGEKRREKATGLLCCTAAFCAVFFGLKQVLFGGAGRLMGAGTWLTALQSPQRLMFWLIAGLCLLLHFVTGTFFFPVAVPAAGRKTLKPAEKRLLLLSAAYAVATAYITAGSVSLNGDFGSMDMRIVLRAFAPASWVFLPLFLVSLAGKTEVEGKRGFRHPAVPAVTAFIALGLLFLRIPRSGSFTDSPGLQFTVLFDRLPAGNVLAKVIPTLLILAGGILWMAERKKALALYVITVLAVMNTVSGILTVKQARTEETPPSAEAWEQAVELDRFLHDLEGNTLMIRTDLTGEDGRLIDTCCSSDYYLIGEDELRRLAAESPEAGVILLKEQDLFTDETGISAYCRTDRTEGRMAARIDHVVCVGDIHRLDGRSMEDITPNGLMLATVYRNADSETLDVENLYALAPGEHILFTRSNPDLERFPNSGFSHPEAGFTWTEGNEATIRFRPETGRFTSPGLYWSWAETIGDQRYAVYADDRLIAEGRTDGKTKIVIPIPEEIAAKDGIICFRFVFPDARQPENGDPRMLAVAFSELSLVELQQAEE